MAHGGAVSATLAIVPVTIWRAPPFVTDTFTAVVVLFGRAAAVRLAGGWLAGWLLVHAAVGGGWGTPSGALAGRECTLA